MFYTLCGMIGTVEQNNKVDKLGRKSLLVSIFNGRKGLILYIVLQLTFLVVALTFKARWYVSAIPQWLLVYLYGRVQFRSMEHLTITLLGDHFRKWDLVTFGERREVAIIFKKEYVIPESGLAISVTVLPFHVFKRKWLNRLQIFFVKALCAIGYLK